MTVSPESKASADGGAELERLMTLGYDRATATTMLQAAGGRSVSGDAGTPRRMEPGERFAAMFGGTFMFFFGLPFTLVPVMMWGTVFGMGGTGMEEEPFGFLIALCFPIPFAMAGLAVQFFGIQAFRVGLKGETEEDGSGLHFVSGTAHEPPPSATSDAFSQSSYPSMADVQQAQPSSMAVTPQVDTNTAGNGMELATDSSDTTTKASGHGIEAPDGHSLSEGIGTEPASEQVSEGAEGGSFWDLKPVDEG